MVILAVTERYVVLARCMILRTTYSGTRVEASLGKMRQTEMVAGTQKHVIVRGQQGEPARQIGQYVQSKAHQGVSSQPVWLSCQGQEVA